jgi:hypothetical protein
MLSFFELQNNSSDVPIPIRRVHALSPVRIPRYDTSQTHRRRSVESNGYRNSPIRICLWVDLCYLNYNTHWSARTHFTRRHRVELSFLIISGRKSTPNSIEEWWCHSRNNDYGIVGFFHLRIRSCSVFGLEYHRSLLNRTHICDNECFFMNYKISWSLNTDEWRKSERYIPRFDTKSCSPWEKL